MPNSRLRRFLQAIVLTSCVSAASTPAALNAPSAQHPTLFLIGDSIVKTGAGTGENGQWGWGSELPALFDPAKITLYNEAIGGRSSRSFIEEGRWDAVLARLQPGDFVMIHFGHNDSVNSKNHPDRTTLPGTGEDTQEIDSPLTHTRKTVHTYGWYLRRYVADAKAKGATVIVVSSAPRQRWTDGKIERGLNGYVAWAGEAAAQSGAFFVNLNALAADRFDALGEKASAPLFSDGTHTTKAGARLNAEAIAAGVRQLQDCALADALK